MSETADTGFGATLGIHNGQDPGDYTVLLKVKRITPPGRTRSEVDVSHLQSPNGYKEFIAGALIEATPVDFEMTYVPSATDVVLAAFEAKTGKYELTAPNGVTIQFDGFFTSYAIGEMTSDGEMMATGTIRPTGKPTLAAAS